MIKTLKVSSANPRHVWQGGLSNRHSSQPRKPLGSGYLDGLLPYGDLWQAHASALSKIPLLLAGRAAQSATEKELRMRTLILSILDRAFKGEL